MSVSENLTATMWAVGENAVEACALVLRHDETGEIALNLEAGLYVTNDEPPPYDHMSCFAMKVTR